MKKINCFFSGSQDEVLGLNKHNEYRATHGVPPMKLNAEMSREAAAYAQKIAQRGVLSHASPSERNNDGENLSMDCGSDGQTTAEATTNWYVTKNQPISRPDSQTARESVSQSVYVT